MKKILVLLFLEATLVHANFMDDAKNITAQIMRDIIEHPFVREVANGTLSEEIFKHYSEQDEVYCWRYSNALLGLASKSRHVELKNFLIRGANDTIANWHGPAPSNMAQCPVCQGYSDFEAQAVEDSFSKGLAAIAPCYVVYSSLGQWLKKNSVANNPYQKWINADSQRRSKISTEKLENFINEVASRLTEAEQKEMLEAYYRSSQFEWNFFDSTYKKRHWKP